MKIRASIAMAFVLFVTSPSVATETLGNRLQDLQKSFRELRRYPGEPEIFMLRLVKLEQKALQLAGLAIHEGNGKIGQELVESVLVMKRIRFEMEHDPNFFNFKNARFVKRKIKGLEAKNQEALELLESTWVD